MIVLAIMFAGLWRLPEIRAGGKAGLVRVLWAQVRLQFCSWSTLVAGVSSHSNEISNHSRVLFCLLFSLLQACR